MNNYKIIITCEHGGNLIPKEYSELFKNHKNLLNSHRGYDLGAWEIAEKLYQIEGDYFFHSKISRLLVDCNRSVRNKNLFSSITKPLDPNSKNRIKEKYYYPYLQSIEQTVQDLIRRKQKVLHLSVHSFTPELNGKIRNADIGILYDPKQYGEKIFSILLKNTFKNTSKFKVRLNYPYLGIADGLPTSLRKKYSPTEYIGIELEINQLLLNSTTTSYSNNQIVITNVCSDAIRRMILNEASLNSVQT